MTLHAVKLLGAAGERTSRCERHSESLIPKASPCNPSMLTLLCSHHRDERDARACNPDRGRPQG